MTVHFMALYSDTPRVKSPGKVSSKAFHSTHRPVVLSALAQSLPLTEALDKSIVMNSASLAILWWLF